MPEGLKKAPKGAGRKKRCNFGQNPAAQNDLILVQTGQNCSSQALVRIKRLVITPLRGVIPPPKGVVREPGSRRLTVRYEKKISCPFAMPYSDGAVSPIRSGPSVPKKKKKKKIKEKLKISKLAI